MPAVIHRAEDDVVRQLIELADFFAMDVDNTCRAEQVGQSSAAHVASDDAQCSRQISEDARKFPRRGGEVLLLLGNVPLDGDQLVMHGV
jgi:hypothetical protein